MPAQYPFQMKIHLLELRPGNSDYSSYVHHESEKKHDGRCETEWEFEKEIESDLYLQRKEPEKCPVWVP